MPGSPGAAFLAINANRMASDRFMDDCADWMSSYTHQGATLDQKRLYAQCVQALYPAPIEDAMTIWLKVGIVLTIALTLGGIWWGMRQTRGEKDYTDKFMMVSMGATMGACTGPLLVAAVWGLLHGLEYVFT